MDGCVQNRSRQVPTLRKPAPRRGGRTKRGADVKPNIRGVWVACAGIALVGCRSEHPKSAAPLPPLARAIEFYQGSDGDLVVKDPTGQEIFLGNKLFAWTFHEREWAYANLTVESNEETILVSKATEGRNRIRPILKAGHLLRGFGPIWIRIRGGYLLRETRPVLTFRVYFGKVLVARKAYDFAHAGTITGTSGMGMETTFWVEPIAFRNPGIELRLRAHEKGYAALGTEDTSGLWHTAETETYSTVDGTQEIPISITARWSETAEGVQAYVDGIEIFR